MSNPFGPIEPEDFEGYVEAAERVLPQVRKELANNLENEAIQHITKLLKHNAGSPLEEILEDFATEIEDQYPSTSECIRNFLLALTRARSLDREAREGSPQAHLEGEIEKYFKGWENHSLIHELIRPHGDLGNPY